MLKNNINVLYIKIKVTNLIKTFLYFIIYGIYNYTNFITIKGSNYIKLR